MKAYYLLDLNYTLIEGTDPKVTPMSRRVELEQYRQWLVELLRPEFTILITARPAIHTQITLDSIAQKTGWRPQAAFFNTHGEPPQVAKKRILEELIFPEFGAPPAHVYLGIESNPATRAMYKAFGIYSLPVPKEGVWARLPECPEP